MQLSQVTQSLVVWLSLGLALLSLVSTAGAEWAALVLIIGAGIPHGAFDLILARRAWQGRSQLGVALLYVFVGLAMSGVCLLQPALGLGVFLVVSLVHFAEGERASIGKGGGALVGAAAIALPITFHLHEAVGYLSFFARAESILAYESILLIVGRCLGLSVLAVAVFTMRRGARIDGVELLLCLGAWSIFSPLAGFCVWFIGRHSRHHLARCRELVAHGPRLFTPDTVAISVVAILLLVPLGIFFDLTQLDQLFAASIVLIAGLTLPHMVVTHRLDASTREDI